MAIEVLEHNGIYTAYRRTYKRGDDGHLFESVKRIDFTFPPAKTEWNAWALSLTPDALDVGMQIFFDRWNFGNGTAAEGEIYNLLCDEHVRRKDQDKIVLNTNGLTVRSTGPVSVTLPPAPPVGTRIFDNVDMKMMLFTGSKWVEVT
jgi:hypothetical protein